MDRILDILGAGFGDGKEYYKEQAYELIRLSNRRGRWTVKDIDKHVKKYLDYGLLRAVNDITWFKGYKKYQLTEKGVLALDYYRNQHHRPLEDGIIKS